MESSIWSCLFSALTLLFSELLLSRSCRSSMPEDCGFALRAFECNWIGYCTVQSKFENGEVVSLKIWYSSFLSCDHLSKLLECGFFLLRTSLEGRHKDYGISRFQGASVSQTIRISETLSAQQKRLNFPPSVTACCRDCQHWICGRKWWKKHWAECLCRTILYCTSRFDSIHILLIVKRCSFQQVEYSSKWGTFLVQAKVSLVQIQMISQAPLSFFRKCPPKSTIPLTEFPSEREYTVSMFFKKCDNLFSRMVSYWLNQKEISPIQRYAWIVRLTLDLLH